MAKCNECNKGITRTGVGHKVSCGTGKLLEQWLKYIIESLAEPRKTPWRKTQIDFVVGIRQGESAKSVRDFMQGKLREHPDSHFIRAFTNAHHAQVRKAIAEGRRVPAKVLADYLN